MKIQKKEYNLGFISDEDIYNHVKKTVLDYRLTIDFYKFNSNLVDPIKLTFDAKIYRMPIKDLIEQEVIRSPLNLLHTLFSNLRKSDGFDNSIG